MPDLNAHLPPSVLTAFNLGTLEQHEVEAVEQHVMVCDQCCQTLLELTPGDDTFVDLLKHVHKHADALTGEAPDPSRPTDDEVSRELTGHPRYEVERWLGRGGMGQVYLARHRLMERRVALKVIRPARVTQPDTVQRFRREVQAAAKLTHPNIVTAFDAEQVGDVHFLVMEYVEGTNLADVVASRGPLPVSEACDFAVQVATGLQHAHEHGMVHRDIKPQNLMLTPAGEVKILDFGLATLADQQRPSREPPNASTGLTSAGTVLGTPDYISPEQARDARDADARSDIYSLGATLYFLLSGRPPFTHESVGDVLRDHSDTEAECLEELCDDVPSELAAAVRRMMAEQPDDRYASMTQVVTVLERFAPETDSADSDSKRSRFSFVKMQRVLATSALMVAVTLLVTFHTLVRRPTSGVPDANRSQASRVTQELRFVTIPAGDFTMGTPPMTKATPAERRHQVTLTRSFEMSAFEITQQQFEWVMGHNPSFFTPPLSSDEVVPSTDAPQFPVENVCWQEAHEFCRRLTNLPVSRKAGHVYRLPTEAEWEFACRAGSTSNFHFGNGLNGTQANVNGKQSWGADAPGPALDRTAPVGSYPPNAFGLYDMHGNVWEWCADWYALDYYINSPTNDPPGPAQGTSRVVRGGAWNWGALHARSATREQRAPDHRDASLGFRVVRVTKPSERSSSLP